MENLGEGGGGGERGGKNHRVTAAFDYYDCGFDSSGGKNSSCDGGFLIIMIAASIPAGENSSCGGPTSRRGDSRPHNATKICRRWRLWMIRNGLDPRRGKFRLVVRVPQG